MPQAAAQSAAPAPDDATLSPLQQEYKVTSAARAAILQDDDAAADNQLTAVGRGELAAKPVGLLLARRATIVCGSLINAGYTARAERLAQRVIQRLAAFKEEKDSDREERLYWEAWLEAKVLDHKLRAIALLRAAENLAPDDERVTALELTLVAAVNESSRESF
jgi:hypothetical protein